MGAILESRYWSENTPLMLAATSGVGGEGVRALVQATALCVRNSKAGRACSGPAAVAGWRRLTARDLQANTALHLAAKKGNVNLWSCCSVRALIWRLATATASSCFMPQSSQGRSKRFKLELVAVLVAARADTTA